jgi:biopolymer transport protein ExbD/biopolymer transport protein TolR
MSASLRRATLISSIDVSPFASVLIVLVALWMVPGLFIWSHTDGVSADPPKVRHPISVPCARREDAILIAVMRNGDIFFVNEQVSPYSLSHRIRGMVKSGSEPVVYVRADARSKWSRVEDVLDEIHSSGLDHVVFLVDQRKSDQ